MKNLKINEFLIKKSATVKEAMRQMNKSGKKILFVVDEEKKLLGTVTDGDIRRWVLSKGDLSAAVLKFYNKNPIFVNEGDAHEEIKKIFLDKKVEGLPVLNQERVVRGILSWNQVFDTSVSASRKEIDLPVVIMAGGKGTRLDPFTKILPKPLIPIQDKTIIEIIMDKFAQQGIKKFYLSINHMSHMVKAYFEEVKLDYKIHYVEEKKPLGTVGSLKLLEDVVKDSLIVSNCDIIIDADYHEIVEFHKKKHNDITIVGSFRHFTIPYGICHIENGGTLTTIEEKPEYDFLVNTGMYILKKKVLKHIPKNKFYNATDLIQAVKDSGGKVGLFPIDEKSWIDVGQWEEYHRTVRLLQLDK